MIKSEAIKDVVVVLLLTAALSALFLGPVWDVDFWWHLSTGKYVVENRHLPEADPFSFTYGKNLPVNEVVLRGYWLGQVIFYLFFKLLGLYGIILLRALLLISVFLLLYVWARRKQADRTVLSALILLTGWFSQYFTGERPQLFSFLFAPLTVFLLEHFRGKNDKGEGSPWSFVLLPAMMLVWANCHRGFPLGSMILFIYCATEAVRNALHRRFQNVRRVLMLFFLTFTVSFVNPNIYKPYLSIVMLQGGALQKATSEYMTPFAVSRFGVVTWPYWTYMAIAVTAFLLSRKRDTAHMLVAAFLALISLTAFRYIPFFLYVTLPLVAVRVTSVIKEKKRFEIVLRRTGSILVGLALAAILFLGVRDKAMKTLVHPIAERGVPEKAVNFIRQNSPPGNIYNYFEWGGYVIWELYPQYKVFIDSRVQDIRAFNDSLYMLWDYPQTPQLFDKYSIDIVLIPERDTFTGEYFTVINYLLRDSRWRLVYRDETALIFLRS